ncbi:unnamed protein product [Orchesella dallaii]|uniref:Uncharacterized protein n=1 Tax=Orchesella dallaii TaxID=48710 RepID=A0ABP1S5U7_9HEXA
MSKRSNESYDEESSPESIMSPTPKIARTNVFPNLDSCLSDHALLTDNEEVTTIEADSNYEFPGSDNEPSSSSNETIVKKSGNNVADDTVSAFSINPDFIQQLQQRGEGYDQGSIEGEHQTAVSGPNNFPAANELSPTLARLYEDYLDISADSEKLQETMNQLGMILPANFQELLQKMVKHPCFKELFKTFFLHFSNTILCATGQDDKDSKEFVDKLNSLEPNTLLGHVGAAMVKEYMEHRIKIDGELPQPAIPVEPVASTIGSGGCGKVEFCAIHGSKMPSQGAVLDANSSFSQIREGESLSTLPPVPNFDTDDRATQNDPQRVTISNKIWDQASDFSSTAENNEKIRTIGKELFKAIFTDAEIAECNIRGSKNKKKFDAEKIRFLKRAIAWLLTEPKTRSQEEFDIYVKEKNPRLTQQDEAFFKTSVLTEYAYSQRLQLKNSKKVKNSKNN